MTALLTPRRTVELGEYQKTRITDLSPTSADQRLADQLTQREHGVRLQVRWLSGGILDVEASSWVGVVRFSAVDIVITPKIVGGTLRVLGMLEYVSGLNILRRLPVDRLLPADGHDLFDLICLLLAEEVEALVRDGLLRDYRPIDDSIEVLRGRLRHRDQLLRRFGQLDRLECRFDEYDGNTAVNQLLLAAMAIARTRVRDRDVRLSAARLAGVLEEVCVLPLLDVAGFERSIHYDRRTDRYRPAHELAKLVIRGFAFDDLFSPRGSTVTAFLIDMNVVFERFVGRLVREAFVGYPLELSEQHRLKAVIEDEETGGSYSTLTPDLVVTDTATGRRVPIDIKYKTYGERKISTGDIYQTFLYALALGADGGERRAGIIYPASESGDRPRLSVKPLGGTTAARILGSGVDVPAALDALRATGKTEYLAAVRSMIERMTGFGTR